MTSLKMTRYGMVMYQKNDMFIGKSIHEYGEWSEYEVQLWRQIIHPGMTVLDVGANIGTHTLALAQLVGRTGKVFAFEPQRFTYYLLAGNIAMNHYRQVYAYRKAVGDTASKIWVPDINATSEFNYGGVSLLDEALHQQNENEGEEVDVTTIDDLHLSACDFIKMDIEGMETTAIHGAERTIKKYRPILHVENNPDDPKRQQELIKAIHQLDYKLYWHITPLFNPENYDWNPKNEFSNIHSFDMFCVPKENSLQVNGLTEVEIKE